MEKYLNKEFIQQHKKQIIQIGAAVLIIIVAIAVYAAGHSDQKDDIDIAQNNNEAQVVSQSEEPEEVIIDICGAVNDSKVVTLPAGARVEDAIKAAGGITDEADLSGIN